MLQQLFVDKNCKQPILRFKNFNDNWEERKLSDIVNYRNGKAHEQYIDMNGIYTVVNSKFISTNGKVKKFSNKPIELLKKGEIAFVLKAHEQYIDMNGIYTVVNSKFISTNGKVKKFSNKPIELLKKGEIAFVLSDVPNGKALAKTYLIDSDNKYSLNQRIAGITPNSDINSYFLYILMNRNRYFLKFDDGVGQTNLSKKDIEEFKENYPLFDEQQKIANLFSKIQNRNRYFLKFDDGVGQTNLSKKDIEEFKENYPLFDEQQKIANLFSKIQTLITRQQNKLTQLIALKKYLLQNLFI